MPKSLDIISLGQAIDTTWGRSSTPQTASYSVKFTLLGGNRLLASYKIITNFVSEKQMIEMKRRCESESADVIDSCLKAVKNTYKELSGSTLSTKEVDSTDMIEIIGFNVHNPKRTAYYRCKKIFEIA